MAPKVLVLAGVPEPDSLDWDSTELLDSFLEPHARFSGIYSSAQPVVAAIGDSSMLDTAVWRSIPLERAHLATGFSQVHELQGEYLGDNAFFTSLSASSQELHTSLELPDSEEASQALLNDFYDHSIAIHDDIPSSQLPPASFSTNKSSLDSEPSNSLQGSMDDNSSLSIVDRTLGLGSAHLSDLEDLPNAKYLDSISPQTMTVNLIAGVISIAEPRTIKTRWGSTKSLVELLVGDETKAGFSITFWLSDETVKTGSKHGATNEILKGLRRQDIVLLRNVALSSFKNKVHGHSLRKDLTSIHLLYRRKLDDDDLGGFYSAKELASRKIMHPQLVKTRKVREWVLNFVGSDVSLGKRKANGKTERSWEDMPPDDTQ